MCLTRYTCFHKSVSFPEIECQIIDLNENKLVLLLSSHSSQALNALLRPYLVTSEEARRSRALALAGVCLSVC